MLVLRFCQKCRLKKCLQVKYREIETMIRLGCGVSGRWEKGRGVAEAAGRGGGEFFHLSML